MPVHVERQGEFSVRFHHPIPGLAPVRFVPPEPPGPVEEQVLRAEIQPRQGRLRGTGVRDALQAVEYRRLRVRAGGHRGGVPIPSEDDIARPRRRRGSTDLALPADVQDVQAGPFGSVEIAVRAVQCHAQVITEDDPTVHAEGHTVGHDGCAGGGHAEHVLRGFDHSLARRAGLLELRTRRNAGCQEHRQVQAEHHLCGPRGSTKGQADCHAPYGSRDVEVAAKFEVGPQLEDGEGRKEREHRGQDESQGPHGTAEHDQDNDGTHDGTGPPDDGGKSARQGPVPCGPGERKDEGRPGFQEPPADVGCPVRRDAGAAEDSPAIGHVGREDDPVPGCLPGPASSPQQVGGQQEREHHGRFLGQQRQGECQGRKAGAAAREEQDARQKEGGRHQVEAGGYPADGLGVHRVESEHERGGKGSGGSERAPEYGREQDGVEGVQADAREVPRPCPVGAEKQLVRVEAHGGKRTQVRRGVRHARREEVLSKALQLPPSRGQQDGYVVVLHQAVLDRGDPHREDHHEDGDIEAAAAEPRESLRSGGRRSFVRRGSLVRRPFQRGGRKLEDVLQRPRQAEGIGNGHVAPAIVGVDARERVGAPAFVVRCDVVYRPRGGSRTRAGPAVSGPVVFRACST